MKADNQPIVGKKIIFLQQKQGLNKVHFASFCGVDNSSLGKIIAGKLRLSAEFALKVSDACKVDLRWLIDDSVKLEDIPKDNSAANPDGCKDLLDAYKSLSEDHSRLLRSSADQTDLLNKLFNSDEYIGKLKEVENPVISSLIERLALQNGLSTTKDADLKKLGRLVVAHFRNMKE